MKPRINGVQISPELRRSDSATAASLHPEASVDVIWIDAGHDAESVFNDITAWKPRMKKTGIMAGHDINLAGVREGLTRAGITYKPISKSSWISGVSSQASVPWT